jgi:hypothetical protein
MKTLYLLMSLYMLPLTSNYVMAKELDSGELFKVVMNSASQCAKRKSGARAIKCYIDASPKKCEPLAYDLFSQSGVQRVKNLYFCVLSCEDADIWSRNFGECARKLK